MNYLKLYISSVFIVSILLSCNVVFSADKTSKDTTSDTWLEAQLVTSYTLNKHLNPFKIDVDVTNGVATITGTVDSDIERDLAVEIARGIDGIKEVRENLMIEPVVQKEKEKSRFVRQVEDATLTAKVKYRMLFNKNIDSFAINVDSEDGVVTLTGKVDSDAKRDLALKLAQNTSGVKEVKNNLSLADTDSMKKEGVTDTMNRQMGNLTRNMGDAWITAKAESLLLISDEAKGALYEVSTKDGIITVSGTALSDRQVKNIQQILEDLQGVKEVNNKLTVR